MSSVQGVLSDALFSFVHIFKNIRVSLPPHIILQNSSLSDLPTYSIILKVVFCPA
jgi:hypothetical protein